jgi:hypothetical protein
MLKQKFSVLLQQLVVLRADIAILSLKSTKLTTFAAALLKMSRGRTTDTRKRSMLS